MPVLFLLHAAACTEKEDEDPIFSEIPPEWTSPPQTDLSLGLRWGPMAAGSTGSNAKTARQQENRHR